MVQWNPCKTDRAFQNIGHPKHKDILNCKISLKSALLLSVVTFLMIRPVGGRGYSTSFIWGGSHVIGITSPIIPFEPCLYPYKKMSLSLLITCAELNLVPNPHLSGWITRGLGSAVRK